MMDMRRHQQQHAGTRRDALFDAIGANASHGYRRTNADKRQAVLTLLNDAEWSKKSDRELARIAHVDPGMVGRLRPQPSVDEPQTRTVSRGALESGAVKRKAAFQRMSVCPAITITPQATVIVANR